MAEFAGVLGGESKIHNSAKPRNNTRWQDDFCHIGPKGLKGEVINTTNVFTCVGY